jgi:hypothetical protein
MIFAGEHSQNPKFHESNKLYIIEGASVLAILLAIGAGSIAAEPSKADFSDAFHAALKIPYHVTNKDTVRARKQALQSVINGFPDDPDLPKAKLAYVDMLLSESTDESYAEADRRLTELVGSEDKLTEDNHRSVAELFARLHIQILRHHRLQRLSPAREVAREMIDLGQSHDIPYFELLGRKYLVVADAQMGNGTEAVKEVFIAMDRCEAWLESGRYYDERKRSFQDFVALQCEIQNTATELGALPSFFANDIMVMRQVTGSLEKGLAERTGAKFSVWKQFSRPELDHWKEWVKHHPPSVTAEELAAAAKSKRLLLIVDLAVIATISVIIVVKRSKTNARSERIQWVHN